MGWETFSVRGKDVVGAGIARDAKASRIEVGLNLATGQPQSGKACIILNAREYVRIGSGNGIIKYRPDEVVSLQRSW